MWDLILGLASLVIGNLICQFLNMSICQICVNSFKHYITEYFLKKLGNVEANIYSYTEVDTKTKFAIF